ncbi:hypothetical protein HPB48_009955 [Haemaphysalis longicornis]|uniref:Brinker DNA-binding domain-containing protein n=1 Tax=Haemaphysalis longicornis TaxID=44386 RepID=A0A9J6GWF9_HAELO|nr:hypothetical protein HPB48_009955 [Haemaphysalis longicornis]
MPPERKSYTAKFKLTAVNYAEQHGNRAAGRHFDVTGKMVHTWRQSTDKLQAMKSGKKADRGKIARWPELEGGLHTWILEQRAQGFRKAGLLASAPGQPELDESSGSSDSEEEAEEAPATLLAELSELFESASEGKGGFEE